MGLLIPLLPLFVIVGLIAGVQLDAWSGIAAFTWMQSVMLVGGLATLVGAVVYGFKRRSVASMWWGVSASILLGMLGAIHWQSEVFPEITDYSSDSRNPPIFEAVASLPENQGKDLSYPVQNSLLIHQYFPRELFLKTDRDPARVLAEAKRIIDLNQWTLVGEDATKGTLEAVVTSRLFQLTDDFMMRVVPEGQGARVDFRSRSREGQRDLGANGLRIMRFRRALENALQKEAGS